MDLIIPTIVAANTLFCFVAGYWLYKTWQLAKTLNAAQGLLALSVFRLLHSFGVCDDKGDEENFN